MEQNLTPNQLGSDLDENGNKIAASTKIEMPGAGRFIRDES